MAKKLKKLLIDRVDLVTAGDNPEAWVSLYKRKDTEGGDNEGLESIIDKVLKCLESLFSKKKGDDPVSFDIKKFLEELPEDQRTPLEKEFAKITDLEKKLQEKEETLGELSKKVEELEKGAKGGDNGAGSGEEDVLKSLPEAVRKMVEDSQKRAEEAEKVAKMVQEKALNEEYIAKAKGFQNLSLKAEDFGPVLKRVAAIGAEDYAKIEAVLKAADEMISKNNLLMKEIGSSSGQTGGDAWAKIEAKAQEIVTKSTDGLTKEQAITKVLRDCPDLYAEYQKELGEV